MPSQIPIYQVDAFTDRPFAGNPAAVCPLDAWLPDGLLQSIAAENNLSETAFFVREGDDYRLRWFTPVLEVDLCGHATLASAFVILTILAPERQHVAFSTRSGRLTVARTVGHAGVADAFTMDFPSHPPHPVVAPPELARALGATPVATLMARDLIAVFDDAEVLRSLRPDMAALSALDARAVLVTAPAPGTGDDAGVDFVSRFFAPRAGIPEDPVTGSAHCALAPYWARRLGRDRLMARQVSARGGLLSCALRGDRVDIGGQAVLVMSGSMRLP